MSQLTGSTLQETATAGARKDDLPDDPPPKDPGKSSGGNSDPPQSQARAAGATIETFTKIVEVVMERTTAASQRQSRTLIEDALKITSEWLGAETGAAGPQTRETSNIRDYISRRTAARSRLTSTPRWNRRCMTKGGKDRVQLLLSMTRGNHKQLCHCPRFHMTMRTCSMESEGDSGLRRSSGAP